MNFSKKGKTDIKRSSYYVWFLGTKESKGLRGDQYVTPVLHYLLEGESAGGSGSPLEHPSKVTLQLSNKGMKIIQILSVPRKSSSSSLSNSLKSEQVKHHIPHDSITWVYQEEDVICAILLLYNPRTRCPVHVHAYRCDSVETADSLRGQLQTLVSRPENQKKFHDIECRLYAKGLLLLPAPATPGNGRNYEEEVEQVHVPFPLQMTRSVTGSQPSPPSYKQHCSVSTSKSALNSDGQSTRTEGSDENSEEFANDLRYVIRSKNVMINRANEASPLLPPLPFSSALEDVPTRSSHSNLLKHKNAKKPGKPAANLPFEEALPAEALRPVALYDSLAAELRAKLGNPKMGPLLLPPRDYESERGQGEKSAPTHLKSAQPKGAVQYPLSRSESSGQSSSGIGSDEALSNGNQRQRQSSSSSAYYDREDNHHHQHHHPLSQQQHHHRDIDIDRHKRSTSFIFGDHQSESRLPPLYHSFPLNDSYVSDSDDDEENDDYHRHPVSDSADEVDTEDIEEDVFFTANFNSRSKSAYDLSHLAQVSGKQSAYESKHYREYHHHQQQQQQPLQPRHHQRPLSYAPPPDIDHHLSYAEHRSGAHRERQSQQQQQQQQHITPLSSASNPNLSRISRQQKEVRQTTTVSDKSAYVMGRRRERSVQQQQQQLQPPPAHLHLISPSSSSAAAAVSSSRTVQPLMLPQKFFYSADAPDYGEVAKSRAKAKGHHEKAQHQQQYHAFVNWHSMH